MSPDLGLLGCCSSFGGHSISVSKDKGDSIRLRLQLSGEEKPSGMTSESLRFLEDFFGLSRASVNSSISYEIPGSAGNWG